MPRFAAFRSTRNRPEPLAAKVPEITVMFWLIKLLTTGMGEATSDFLGNTNLLLAGVVGVFGFAGAMWWQFRVRRYEAVTYWFAVMMVAVFGTMVADALHVGLGIPYIASTIVYALVLAYVLRRWYRSEGTLSIHSITTRRRETYYWITVLATFALGTAAGDLTATELNLGFFSSIFLFGGAMLVPIVGRWVFGMSSVATFWIAYVLTRPLGASIADWLGKPHDVGGGLNYGDGTVAGIALIAIAALVAWVAVTRRDVQRPEDSLSFEPDVEPNVAAARPVEG